VAVCIRLPQNTHCTLTPCDGVKWQFQDMKFSSEVAIMLSTAHNTIFQWSGHNVIHCTQHNLHIDVLVDRPACQIYSHPPFYVWLFIILRISAVCVEVFAVRSMWKGETVNQGHTTVNTVLPWVGSVGRYLTISARYSCHLYLLIYVPYDSSLISVFV